MRILSHALALAAGVVSVLTSTTAAQPFPSVPYRVGQFPVSTLDRPRACDQQDLFVSLGDRCVFVADGPAGVGQGLWVTDGTNAGTELVIDCDPRPTRSLRATGSLAYERGGVRRAAYIAYDEVSDLLIDTDGTPGGTRVERLPVWQKCHLLQAVAGRPMLWTWDGRLRFWVLGDEGVRELSIPGLTTGTTVSFSGASATSLYFIVGYNSLWRTDGTSEGTVHITGSTRDFHLFNYFVAGERLFLTDRFTPYTLWTLDPGSTVLRSLPAPSGSTFDQFRTGFAPLPDGSGVLIGTREGTLRCDLADLSFSPFLTGVSVTPPPGGDETVFPRVIQSPAGPRTLLYVRSSSGTPQYWSTDGTPEGTALLIDQSYLVTLGWSGDRHYFTSGFFMTSVSGIWVTDGTPAGTARLSMDYLTTYSTQTPYAFAAMAGDRLVVRPRTVRTADAGLLWSVGPDRVIAPLEAVPGFPVMLGSGTQLAPGIGEDGCGFGVSTGGTGQFFATAGPSLSTTPVSPTLRPMAFLGRGGGSTWWAVQTPSGDSDLWRSDGTTEGTLRVDALPFVTYRYAAPGGDGILLSLSNAGLYTSDGSPGSLRRLTAAGGASFPYQDPAGRIFQTVADWNLGSRLSVINPVTGTATLLASMTYGTDIRYAAVGPATYVTDAAELSLGWRTQGTPATTARIAGGAALATSSVGAAGGKAILALLHEYTSADLIAEDPVTGQFTLLRNFPFVDSIVTFGDRAVFLADDGVHGTEPWITDGTPGGTRMIAETVPGLRGAVSSRYCYPNRFTTLTAGRDRCYFQVADDTLAAHAWCTDGTAGGTRPLMRYPEDPRTLPINSYVFFETPDAVYFTGWTEDRGGDLYAVRLCDADFSADGLVDFFDLLDYLDAFDAGTPDADFNGDGFLDFFDFDAFVRAFERGC